jgi:hypothetical protein
VFCVDVTMGYEKSTNGNLLSFFFLFLKKILLKICKTKSLITYRHIASDTIGRAGYR